LEKQIMPDFAYRTEATIDAAPKVLFDIVSDLSLHTELAGSGELKTVTHEPTAAVDTGTRFLAEELVKLADGSGMDVTSDSVVVICDTPTTFSWIASPVLPDRLRRVQWWFQFTPADDRTRVVHEVEIDFGDLQDEMLKGLRDNFEQVRAPVVRAGMDRTLENLRKMAAR
jgi:Polyketide cyclase / dehydrase and lipid transport